MKKLNKKAKTALCIYSTTILSMALFATPVFADGDPVTVVNNLSDFYLRTDKSCRHDPFRIWCCSNRFVFKKS